MMNESKDWIPVIFVALQLLVLCLIFAIHKYQETKDNKAIQILVENNR